MMSGGLLGLGAVSAVSVQGRGDGLDIHAAASSGAEVARGVDIRRADAANAAGSAGAGGTVLLGGAACCCT